MSYDKREEMLYDILHSDCRDCFVNNLECTYYYGKCRLQDSEE